MIYFVYQYVNDIHFIIYKNALYLYKNGGHANFIVFFQWFAACTSLQPPSARPRFSCRTYFSKKIRSPTRGNETRKCWEWQRCPSHLWWSQWSLFFPASSLHGFMACPAGAWCACRCFALKRDLVCGLCLTAFWTYAIFLPKFRPTSSWLHVSYQLFICFTGWIKWWSQHL